MRQSSEEREWTVWLIGLIGPAHVTRGEVEALVQVVEGGGQPWLRVAAIQSLGRLRRTSKLALQRLVQGAEEDSIQAAWTALMDFDGTH